MIFDFLKSLKSVKKRFFKIYFAIMDKNKKKNYISITFLKILIF